MHSLFQILSNYYKKKTNNLTESIFDTYENGKLPNGF